MPVLLCHSPVVHSHHHSQQQQQRRRSDRIRSLSSVPLPSSGTNATPYSLASSSSFHSSSTSVATSSSSKRSAQPPPTALRKRPRQHSPENARFHRTGSSFMDTEEDEDDYASTPRSLRALKRQKLIELKMTLAVPNLTPAPSNLKGPGAAVKSHSPRTARTKKKLAKFELNLDSAARDARSRWASSFASGSPDPSSDSSPRSTPRSSALSSSGRKKEPLEKDNESKASENRNKDQQDQIGGPHSTLSSSTSPAPSANDVRADVNMANCTRTAVALTSTLGSEQSNLHSISEIFEGEVGTRRVSNGTSAGLSSTITTTRTRTTTDFTVVTQASLDYSQCSPPPLFPSLPLPVESSTYEDVEMGCSFSRSRSPSASTAIALESNCPSLSHPHATEEEVEEVVPPPTVVVSQRTPLTLRLEGSGLNDPPFSLDPELEPSRFGLDACVTSTEEENGSQAEGLTLEFGGEYELFGLRESGDGLRQHLLQQHREERSRVERRRERREGNIWKAACRERVDGMFSRYDPETIRSFVVAQAEDDPPRMPFMEEYSDSESDYSDEDEDDESQEDLFTPRDGSEASVCGVREFDSESPPCRGFELGVCSPSAGGEDDIAQPEEQKEQAKVELTGDFEGGGCFYASPLTPTSDPGYGLEAGLEAGSLAPSSSSAPSLAEADNSLATNSITLEESSVSSSSSMFQPRPVLASAFSSGYQLPPFTFAHTLSFSMFGFGVPVPLPVPPPPLASLRAMSLLGSAWPVYCGRGTPVDRRRRDDWGKRLANDQVRAGADAGRHSGPEEKWENLFELFDRVSETNSGTGDGTGWYEVGERRASDGERLEPSSSSLSGALSFGLGT